MAFCPNCGNKIEDGGVFCGACGTSIAAPAAPAAPVEPAAPAWAAPTTSTPAASWSAPAPSAPAWSAPQTPTYSAPTYSAPAWNAPVKDEVSGGTKAKGIVGMVMGIFGMVFGIIGLICTMTFLGTWYSEEGFFLALYFSIFSLPLSIVGKVLASGSQDAGNTSGVCSAGKGMGLAGIILSAVMLFFGFICLM